MVSLQAPPIEQAAQELLASMPSQQYADGCISISEAVGPAAHLRATTILTLAATERDSAYGTNLRLLGVPAFQDLAKADNLQGIYVMVPMGEQLNGRLWASIYPIDQDGSRAEILKGPSKYGYVFAASQQLSGSYWLKLADDDGVTRLLLPIVVLDGRITFVVLTHDERAVFQYAQKLGVMPEDKWGNPELDPYFKDSPFAAMRRIEMIQRSTSEGRIDASNPDIDFLLYGKWLDPIAGALGCYLRIRNDPVQSIGNAARNMVKYFPDMPDSHVIMGLYQEELDQQGAARKCYEAAVSIGIPIFKDGLDRLASALEVFRIDRGLTNTVLQLSRAAPTGALWSSSLKTSHATFEAPPNGAGGSHSRQSRAA